MFLVVLMMEFELAFEIPWEEGSSTIVKNVFVFFL
jgi:hypothetical protein